jgi:hypothetical protein
MSHGAPKLALSAEEQRRVGEVERLRAAGRPGPLVELLVDPSWAVRREVAAALAARGDAAVPPLCE